jgi:UDP-glucose 4-epimerase
MNILVTGGCGYIGSHMVRVLLRAGHRVTIVDDLRTGDASTIPLGEEDGVIFLKNTMWGTHPQDLMGIDAVIHFAASSIVADSIRNPAEYFQNNVAAGIALLKNCLDAGIKKFIFSSSAAVYGWPEWTNSHGETIREDHPKHPLSPYGESKLMFENILDDYSTAYGLRSVSLRYFNAAGACNGLRERHEPETHLIPLAIDAARDLKLLTVYGTDYPTPDGTAVRDYVHVTDLCTGHLKALEYLAQGGRTTIINLGSGKGASVMEVIAMVNKVTDRQLGVVTAPRRPGDSPALVANIARAHRILGWTPTKSLEEIVRDAWASRR